MISPVYTDCKFSSFVLNNGIKVVLVSLPSSTKAAVCLSVSSGSQEDPKEYQGLHHFLEHMVFLGTEKYPVEGELDRFLSAHSGYNNAYTGDDLTCFEMEVEPQALDEALDIFSSYFICPLFSKDAIDREVNAVDSEHNNYKTQTEWRLDQLLHHLCLEDHYFNYFGTGNRATLVPKGSSPEITQNQLINLFETRYSSVGMVIALSSSQSLQTLNSLVKKHFENIKNRPFVRFDERILGVDDFSKREQLVELFGAEFTTKLNHLSSFFSLREGSPQLPIDIMKNATEVQVLPQIPINTVPPIYNSCKERFFVSLCNDASTTLHLFFVLPASSINILSDTPTLLRILFSNQGDGSLYTRLKSMDLITEIDVEIMYQMVDFTLIDMSLTLTLEGTVQLEEIFGLADVFFEMHREAPSPIYLLNEARIIKGADFFLNWNKTPLSVVTDTVENVQCLPVQFGLCGTTVPTNFSEEEYRAFLKEFRTENSLIILTMPAETFAEWITRRQNQGRWTPIIPHLQPGHEDNKDTASRESLLMNTINTVLGPFLKESELLEITPIASIEHFCETVFFSFRYTDVTKPIDAHFHILPPTQLLPDSFSLLHFPDARSKLSSDHRWIHRRDLISNITNQLRQTGTYSFPRYDDTSYSMVADDVTVIEQIDPEFYQSLKSSTVSTTSGPQKIECVAPVTLELLFSTPTARVFHQQTSFIRSPQTTMRAISHLSADALSKFGKEHLVVLSEMLYTTLRPTQELVEQVGGTLEFSTTSTSFQLIISSYSSSFERILSTVLDHLSRFEITESCFHPSHTSRIEIAESYTKQIALKLAQQYASSIQKLLDRTPDDALKRLISIDVREMNDLKASFSSESSVDIYFYGNISPEDVSRAATTLLSHPFWKSDSTNQRQFLEESEPVPLLPFTTYIVDIVHPVQTAHNSAVIMDLIPTDRTNPLIKAAVSVFQQWADPIYFDSMRTKEALGYSVMIAAKVSPNDTCLSFKAMGNHFHALHLQARLEANVSEIINSIQQISQSEFLAARDSVVLELKSPPTSIFEESDVPEEITTHPVVRFVDIQIGALMALTKPMFHQIIKDLWSGNAVETDRIEGLSLPLFSHTIQSRRVCTRVHAAQYASLVGSLPREMTPEEKEQSEHDGGDDDDGNESESESERENQSEEEPEIHQTNDGKIAETVEQPYPVIFITDVSQFKLSVHQAE
ncbi:putative Insulin-degrading enzyme [Blattamonas nauphoetae]|uniref:Insulin-degrading enzyme n=1 Tax=Blattamonas nauphoetae TaxID=2049346 RepID=A0ABQ9XJD7_9EUKA|nr:putative Insulin-degrading enzyme [Blattamonas nauphoetae]